MFPKPLSVLAANTFAVEDLPLVKPTGFCEYNARWLCPDEINLMGMQALGLGLATVVHDMGICADIVTGHDFRAYSASIKLALVAGMQAAVLRVKYVGLALSPMAYFGQFAFDCPFVAMVTASHNDNGWNGVKMGADRPMTFVPEEIGGINRYRDRGAYEFVEGFAQTYLNDLRSRAKQITRELTLVAAYGNNTARAFAPKLLEELGVAVVPLDVTPDYTFPRSNPNPEDTAVLHAIACAVKEYGADVGLIFDDDRCGVIGDQGEEIFADKIGVMLVRDLGKFHPGLTFVVDVKSTGLYMTDLELQAVTVKTDYWKTGHSYIKRRVNELSALAGFEKFGRFFFNEPIGRGYDDGLLTAIAVIEILDRNPGLSRADLYRALLKTWRSPTMSSHCADITKHGIVERVTGRFRAMKEAGLPIADGRSSTSSPSTACASPSRTTAGPEFQICIASIVVD